MASQFVHFMYLHHAVDNYMCLPGKYDVYSEVYSIQCTTQTCTPYITLYYPCKQKYIRVDRVGPSLEIEL